MAAKTIARRAEHTWKIAPIAIGLIVALAACEDEKVEREIIRPVWAMKVGDVSAIIENSFPGRAKAENEVNRSFRVSGPLITRPVNVGDEVKEGEVLARIDPQDFEVRLGNIEGQLERAKSELAAMRIARPEDIRSERAALEEAEAALTLAQQDLDRVNRIKEQDSGAIAQAVIDRAVRTKRIAEAEVRRANESLRVAEIGARPEDIAAKEAQIQSLQASVQSAQDDLSYTYLRAPFDGTVVATYVENFEFVQAQQPIVRLLDPASMEFTIFVPENLIGLAPYVETVNVRFDAIPDVEIKGSVKEISKEASQATRTYPVTLIMELPPGAEVLPGMAGKATITAKAPEGSGEVGIDIPATAIFSGEDPAKSYVWVIDETNKTLMRREVEIGRLTNFGVLVKAGLEPGEWVLYKGVNSVREGQQVQIIDEKGESQS